MILSVIIPTLNEARRLPALIARLRGEASDAEIIIVDGGSTDATVTTAGDLGLQVIETAPGRGGQLCAGADAALGDVLFFLHADTDFPAGGLAAIATALDENADAVGGNFRLLFDGDNEISEWLNGFYTQIRRRGVYYGDSGIFVRRRIYETLGGIRPIALMEDYDFVRRMENYGNTICIDQPALTSSSRRFAGRRKWAIIAGWMMIHVLFYLGVPPGWLANCTIHTAAASGPMRRLNAPSLKVRRSRSSRSRNRQYRPPA
ncbi:MAG: glycosyltransferase family 2 protein [Rhodospirillaceae bacterium]|nr:glycosyltransferase family 2 protein [Rhodospirillaceae bacterium]